MVTIFLLLTTDAFAEERPKNSLDCLKDPDCSEEMQQNQEQPAKMTEEDPIVNDSNTPSLWLNLVQMAIMLFIIFCFQLHDWACFSSARFKFKRGLPCSFFYLRGKFYFGINTQMQ